MASRSNPNMPTRYKGRVLAAKRAKHKKVTASRIAKKRAAPAVPDISGKKAKKLVRQQGYANQRRLEKMMEEGGEVRMVDAPPKYRKEESKNKEDRVAKEADMGVE